MEVGETQPIAGKLVKIRCFDLAAEAALQSEQSKSVWGLRHYIGSRHSFKVRTARPATESQVRSLNLDHEVGFCPPYQITETQVICYDDKEVGPFVSVANIHVPVKLNTS